MPAREEVLLGGSKKREKERRHHAVNAKHRAVISMLKEQEVTAWPMEEAIDVRQRAVISTL